MQPAAGAVVQPTQASPTRFTPAGAGPSQVDAAVVTRIVGNQDTAVAIATVFAYANPKRKKLLVFNEATNTLYLKFGTGARSTDYSVQIGGGAYYEMPVDNVVYTGIVTGIWPSGGLLTQFAQVTEW